MSRLRRAPGWRAAAAALAAALLLSGCERPPEAPADPAAGPDAFRVLAGSELKELEPELKRAAAAAGVPLALSYAGTLDIVERINAGESFDAVLPPNGAYPSLALSTRPVAREKLFYSRVALGVKQAKAAALGWDRAAPTWAQIAAAAREGRFSYAMTNPTASNTGMSALFAVAAAGAGKTEDIGIADVRPELLKAFLAGQRITAGSSGWLAEAYEKDAGRVDGLVNYEAVLMRLNERLPAGERLVVIYPKDGVISADYPLLLLAEGKREAYGRLVAAFKDPAFQGGAVRAAYLRPSVPQAAAAPALSTAPVAELAFPNRLEVIDEVLSAYQSEWRRPATSVFVLDVSGSMRGERLDAMRAALNVLAGADTTSLSARLTRFQARERVVLIAFSNEVGAPVTLDFGPDPQAAATREQVLAFSSGLRADGGTAIYSALQAAYRIAAQERQADPQRFVTIALLSDGENNAGASYEQFVQAYDRASGVRVFPILFGEANVKQMHALAEATGGRAFDGRKAALAAVFKEIRGYQ